MVFYAHRRARWFIPAGFFILSGRLGEQGRLQGASIIWQDAEKLPFFWLIIWAKNEKNPLRVNCLIKLKMSISILKEVNPIFGAILLTKALEIKTYV